MYAFVGVHLGECATSCSATGLMSTVRRAACARGGGALQLVFNELCHAGQLLRAMARNAASFASPSTAPRKRRVVS